MEYDIEDKILEKLKATLRKTTNSSVVVFRANNRDNFCMSIAFLNEIDLINLHYLTTKHIVDSLIKDELLTKEQAKKYIRDSTIKALEASFREFDEEIDKMFNGT